eukprot:TRINITY_DN1032_c0_g1_i3.p1 TRINITY_DN1032_c0_g1~~TRINITY_DN1032_c0_g1_i3.p1  ORF type:complete len:895 (-),score=244.87 TRINITY_DN1032_c0_g1_i3:101-2785(-)
MVPSPPTQEARGATMVGIAGVATSGSAACGGGDVGDWLFVKKPAPCADFWKPAQSAACEKQGHNWVDTLFGGGGGGGDSKAITSERPRSAALPGQRRNCLGNAWRPSFEKGGVSTRPPTQPTGCPLQRRAARGHEQEELAERLKSLAEIFGSCKSGGSLPSRKAASPPKRPQSSLSERMQALAKPRERSPEPAVEEKPKRRERSAPGPVGSAVLRRPPSAPSIALGSATRSGTLRPASSGGDGAASTLRPPSAGGASSTPSLLRPRPSSAMPGARPRTSSPAATTLMGLTDESAGSRRKSMALTLQKPWNDRELDVFVSVELESEETIVLEVNSLDTLRQLRCMAAMRKEVRIGAGFWAHRVQLFSAETGKKMEDHETVADLQGASLTLLLKPEPTEDDAGGLLESLSAAAVGFSKNFVLELKRLVSNKEPTAIAMDVLSATFLLLRGGRTKPDAKKLQQLTSNPKVFVEELVACGRERLRSLEKGTMDAVVALLVQPAFDDVVARRKSMAVAELANWVLKAAEYHLVEYGIQHAEVEPQDPAARTADDFAATNLATNTTREGDTTAFNRSVPSPVPAAVPAAASMQGSAGMLTACSASGIAAPAAPTPMQGTGASAATYSESAIAAASEEQGTELDATSSAPQVARDNTYGFEQFESDISEASVEGGAGAGDLEQHWAHTGAEQPVIARLEGSRPNSPTRSRPHSKTFDSYTGFEDDSSILPGPAPAPPAVVLAPVVERPPDLPDLPQGPPAPPKAAVEAPPALPPVAKPTAAQAIEEDEPTYSEDEEYEDEYDEEPEEVVPQRPLQPLSPAAPPLPPVAPARLGEKRPEEASYDVDSFDGEADEYLPLSDDEGDEPERVTAPGVLIDKDGQSSESAEYEFEDDDYDPSDKDS